jgi:hypothetical protein
MTAEQQSLERLRAETSMVYRLVLVMLAAVTEDGQHNDSGAFAAAMDTCDGVIAAEGDWSAQQWQDVAQHLALLVAAGLAAEMWPDEATEYMRQQVGLALDPAAFRAALEGGGL